VLKKYEVNEKILFLYYLVSFVLFLFSFRQVQASLVFKFKSVVVLRSQNIDSNKTFSGNRLRFVYIYQMSTFFKSGFLRSLPMHTNNICFGFEFKH